ncbi:MAG: outer membrane lipoprotein-sorting protein, partial [Candidatus Neomarinimicrobiota bacterium]
MKIAIINKLSFVLVFLHLVISAQIPEGQVLIDSMTAQMSPENSRSLMLQTNHYADGRKRTFEFEMFSGNKGEKSLLRYIKPVSVKGQSFLMLNDGDDIWTYFPRTRRVRKLASHAKKQKVQGSDFSFEDFASQDTWEADYNTTNLGSVSYEGTDCWKLESLRKEDSEEDFPRIILFIRVDTFYPLRIDYYANDNKNEKSMTLNEIE